MTRRMEHRDDELVEFEANGTPALPAPDAQGYVENDGARIWFASCGVGPSVVLLHGGRKMRQRLVEVGALAQERHRQHVARIAVPGVGFHRLVQERDDRFERRIFAGEGAFQLVDRRLVLPLREEHLAGRQVHEAMLFGRQRLLRQIAELARVAMALPIEALVKGFPFGASTLAPALRQRSASRISDVTTTDRPLARSAIQSSAASNPPGTRIRSTRDPTGTRKGLLLTTLT